MTTRQSTPGVTLLCRCLRNHRRHLHYNANTGATPEPKQLTLDSGGEGAINNIRRHAREAIVQVEDENHKAVAGVAVTFFPAERGPSGVFANGSQSMTNGPMPRAGRDARHEANKVAGRCKFAFRQTRELNAMPDHPDQRGGGAGPGRCHFRQGHRSDRGGGRRSAVGLSATRGGILDSLISRDSGSLVVTITRGRPRWGILTALLENGGIET